MPEDKDKTGKPDLKARLGRKRFKTGTSKSLKSLKQMKTQGAEEPAQAAPSAPQAPQAPAPMDSGMAPAPMDSGMAPMDSGMAPAPMDSGTAPASDSPDTQTPAFVPPAKSNHKMTWIIAGAVALISIGIGYSCGHRAEQNSLLNTAKRDAKKLLKDVDAINKGLETLYQAFSSVPDKLEGFVEIADMSNPMPEPNLVTLGTAKINYIPRASKRKRFSAALLTLYAYSMMVRDDFIDYQRFVSSTLKRQAKLLKAIDAQKGKTLSEKISNYIKSLSKDAGKNAKTKKGSSKFIILLEASSSPRGMIVPFDPANTACPKSKPSCADYEKVYRFNGAEYKFTPEANKPLNGQRMAIKFDSIAEDSAKIIAQYEIQIPVKIYYRQALLKFKRLRRDLEAARKNSGSILDDLKRASKRKDRGWF